MSSSHINFKSLLQSSSNQILNLKQVLREKNHFPMWQLTQMIMKSQSRIWRLFSVYTEAALHSATRRDKRLDAIIVSDRKIPYYTEKKYDLNLLRNRNWGKSKRWQMRTWRKFPKQYPKRIKFWDWAKLRGTKKIPICYLCNWRSISIHVKYFNDTQNQSSQQTNLHSRLRIVCRSNSKPIKRLSENPIFDVKKRESKIIKKDKKKPIWAW